MLIRVATAVLLFSFGSVLLAQASWQGTWTLVQSERHNVVEFLTFEKGTDGSLTIRNEGRAPVRCFPDGVPRKDTATGLDYFAALDGSRGFVLQISRGNAHVLLLSAELSSNAKTLTESITDYDQNDATSHRSIKYVRVSGDHGFAGKWQTQDPDTGGPPRTFIVEVKANGYFSASLPGFYRSVSAKPGGPAGGILGLKMPTGSVVALTQDNAQTMHWTMRTHDSVPVAGSAVLSTDGRTLRVESWPLHRPDVRSVAVYARQP